MSLNAVATATGHPQAQPAPARFDPRTRHLIEAPITPTLLRLAGPNVLVMVVQASVGLIETYFVGKLGTDALAGVALVFPALMLMQMMSAGAMGGGISSAIARALGAGRRSDADALALHALAIAVGLRACLYGGGARWRAMALWRDGRQRRIARCGADLFQRDLCGAVLLWLFNSLANVVRGTGNMAVPAVVTCVGAVALIPLSPCLIFGWGPFPPARHRRRRRCGDRILRGGQPGACVVPALGAQPDPPLAAPFAFRWTLFREILRVGAVAALITVGTNVTIAVATGLVGQFGPAAIAGYGTGSRIEYLLVPLVFGLGGPLVAMVGTNIGAGERERALRAAWIGAAIAAALCGSSASSRRLSRMPGCRCSTTNAAMLDAGARYLRVVGPFYGLFGLGMALYFASQGAGRLAWPLIANLTRLAIAAAGGWLALRLSGDLTSVFVALAVALAAFGLINAVAVAAGAWFGPVRLRWSPRVRGKDEMRIAHEAPSAY